SENHDLPAFRLRWRLCQSPKHHQSEEDPAQQFAYNNQLNPPHSCGWNNIAHTNAQSMPMFHQLLRIGEDDRAREHVERSRHKFPLQSSKPASRSAMRSDASWSAAWNARAAGRL